MVFLHAILYFFTLMNEMISSIVYTVHTFTLVLAYTCHKDLTFGNFAESGCSHLRYHAWYPRLLPLHQTNDHYQISNITRKIKINDNNKINKTIIVQTLTTIQFQLIDGCNTDRFSFHPMFQLLKHSLA